MTHAAVKVEGTRMVRRALVQRANQASKILATEVAITARDVRQTARDHLDDPTGRPVTRTGQLARSISIVYSADGLTANIGTLLEYGAHLEFGTRTIPPYPWLAPALAVHLQAFKLRARAALEKSFRVRAK